MRPEFQSIPKEQIIRIRAELKAHHMVAEGNVRLCKVMLHSLPLVREAKLAQIERKTKSHLTERKKNLNLAVNVQIDDEINAWESHLRGAKHECRLAHLARSFFDGKLYRHVEHSCHRPVSEYDAIVVPWPHRLTGYVPLGTVETLFKAWLEEDVVHMATVSSGHDGTGFVFDPLPGMTEHNT